MIRRIFWKIVGLLYVRIAKPLLFLVPPDTTHNWMLRGCAAIGSVPVFRVIVRLVFTRRNERLVQTYHGIKFENPVGLSAGFDKNGEIVPVIAALGFGFSEVGSVTAELCDGNPRPWFYRLPKTQSLVVNAGLANDGSQTVIVRLGRFSARSIKNFPVILSVAKTNNREVVDEKSAVADYVTTVKRACGQKNIAMIELNISCPNTFGGEPFTTPDRLKRLLAAVDKVKDKQPVYIKMPNDLLWPEFKKLLDVVVQHQIAGVTISNLAKDRTKLEIKDKFPDTVHGNLSGKPTRKTSNELIRQTYLNFGDKLTIIGVGGIFSAGDAYEKIKLGASLVEFITGMIFLGPQLAAEINDGLAEYLEQDGYTHISQAIGVDASAPGV